MAKNRIPTDRVLTKLDEYLGKNDYSGAKKHLNFWLSEAEFLNDNNGMLLMFNELMGLCRKLGQRDEAVNFADVALKHIEKTGIEQNVGAATTFLNAATVYKAFERAKESIPLFQKAENIYKRNLSPDDERFGGLYNNMALAYVDLKEFSNAYALYEKALKIMSDKAPEQAITYLNMASCAEAEEGLEDGAEKIAQYAEKAMQLLEECKERNDGNYAFVLEKCAGVFSYYGYFYYANQITERYRRIYEGT